MSAKSFIGRSGLVLIAVLLASGTAMAKRYMLYTDSTLAQAGVVTPSVSQAHYYEEGEVVTIAAQPYKGYEFVCWIGDVENPDSRSTRVVMDGPRYVVASFQVAESDEAVEVGIKSLEEGGRSRTIPAPNIGYNDSISSTDYSSSVESYLAAAESPGTLSKPDVTNVSAPDYRRPSDVNPNPIIPEPATVTLLAAGAAGLAARRLRKKNSN
ncbi:InlB B-repeat-containing protein [Sedimentisphaera salicampi]|uniref:InlB B-repeat-containing protein n=1 Tax=Sedimentisphaera salicampi TaxID=1941349 RepID=UPI000B9C0DAD|nr:PEP-CTERM sorting domain-containing protein [Sedimentisphaera salicampi]OXU14517.1 hypothetical protein SMSP1_01828 [Sedimentisphaera salicampi]